MKKRLLPILCLAASAALQAQNVTTLYDFGTEEITDDIIFDSAGNLFGADYNGPNLYKITPDGEVSIFAGGFQAPNGLAFDSQGNLFMCDNIGDEIVKMDSDGNILDTYPIDSPSGIIKEFDSDTLVFTTYQGGQTIKKLAPDGTITNMFQGSGLNGPVGLTYDDQDQLYIANFTDRKIFRVEGDDIVQVVQLPGSGALGFITFTQGHIFATAFTADKIYKVNPFYPDSIVAVYGGNQATVDGPVETARFNSPNGIRASITGDTLFVSQYNNGVIRIITDLTLSTTEAEYVVDFEIYPNPSTGTINIKNNAPLDVIRIFDVQGRVVFEERGGLYNEIIQVDSGLPNGMYMLEITQHDGLKGLRKIVIE